MLDAIAQLPQNIFRNIGWILRNEKYAHTFRADESRYLLHLIDQCFGRVIKQKVCLVKKED